MTPSERAYAMIAEAQARGEEPARLRVSEDFRDEALAEAGFGKMPVVGPEKFWGVPLEVDPALPPRSIVLDRVGSGERREKPLSGG